MASASAEKLQGMKWGGRGPSAVPFSILLAGAGRAALGPGAPGLDFWPGEATTLDLPPPETDQREPNPDLVEASVILGLPS